MSSYDHTFALQNQVPLNFLMLMLTQKDPVLTYCQLHHIRPPVLNSLKKMIDDPLIKFQIKALRHALNPNTINPSFLTDIEKHNTQAFFGCLSRPVACQSIAWVDNYYTYSKQALESFYAKNAETPKETTTLTVPDTMMDFDTLLSSFIRLTNTKLAWSQGVPQVPSKSLIHLQQESAIDHLNQSIQNAWTWHHKEFIKYFKACEQNFHGPVLSLDEQNPMIAIQGIDHPIVYHYDPIDNFF